MKALRTVATGGVEKRTFGHRAPHRPTVGTPFHGKQVDPDKLVWAIGALAEGLGIRAVARVFQTDPNTVLGWLVEAADHLEAFSRRSCTQSLRINILASS